MGCKFLEHLRPSSCMVINQNLTHSEKNQRTTRIIRGYHPDIPTGAGEIHYFSLDAAWDRTRVKQTSEYGSQTEEESLWP